ncbi:MAG: TdeIII family type II restriction endonuclease [candidate division WOR-3 bacterium]
MKLKDTTRKNIIGYLEGFLQGLVNKYDPDVVKNAVIKQVWLDPKKGKYKPFHTALLPPHFLRLHSFFRSFDTSLGQGVFEYIAQLIASDNTFWVKVERNYTLAIPTNNRIKESIATFIENVKRKKERPYPPPPLPRLEPSSSEGQEILLRADLYLEDKNDKKYFFEIKSPEPNKDVCSQTKEKFLYFIAGIGPNGVYKFCFPYNPWGEEKVNYKWGFTLSLFDLNNEILIGKEFWDFIGGEGSYEAVLDVFREVGTTRGEELLNKLIRK